MTKLSTALKLAFIANAIKDEKYNRASNIDIAAGNQNASQAISLSVSDRHIETEKSVGPVNELTELDTGYTQSAEEAATALVGTFIKHGVVSANGEFGLKENSQRSIRRANASHKLRLYSSPSVSLLIDPNDINVEALDKLLDERLANAKSLKGLLSDKDLEQYESLSEDIKAVTDQITAASVDISSKRIQEISAHITELHSVVADADFQEKVSEVQSQLDEFASDVLEPVVGRERAEEFMNNQFDHFTVSEPTTPSQG